jgi:hypothetical protein
MSSMSNYLETKIVDWLFRGVSFTPPTTLYIALCTSAPTDSSTGSTLSEISGGNYTRQSIVSNSTNWAAISSGNGTTSNSVEIKWASVTWTGTVSHIAICDALTGGNILFYNALSNSQAVSNGDTLSFGANNLSIQIDD